jgi:segregation and condensation protein A
MSEYRVNLEVYNGPLDLLLYLIRREEVDIYDIPIARVTQQYVQYVDLLRKVDPDLAGEFLVMAATLMEIKTRMMLPATEAAEGDAEPLEIDPRAELVRQLLEYKAFKDAAGDLRDAHDERSLRFSPGLPAQAGEDNDVDLEDVQIWDLFDAFSNVLKAIGAEPGVHHVILDDTPLELHAAEIMSILTNEGPTSFDRLFDGGKSRMEMVGLFLALLELVRRKRVLAAQDANFGRISLCVNPDPPDQSAGEEHTPADEREGDAAVEGTYVPKGDAQEHGEG